MANTITASSWEKEAGSTSTASRESREEEYGKK